MPYIATLDGGSIFYTDEGAGPGILMIHGWSCHGSDWAWMQADFACDHRTKSPPCTSTLAISVLDRSGIHLEAPSKGR